MPRRLRLATPDGRILRQQVAGAGETSAEFNTEGLPAGLYLLQIQDGEASRWVKVVVE